MSNIRTRTVSVGPQLDRPWLVRTVTVATVKKVLATPRSPIGETIALFGSYTRMLFVTMALLAIAAVAIARYIQTSWLGRGLRAIRDTEFDWLGKIDDLRSTLI
jgi:ABC-type branched-subunit amino acid transport system permease subunit